jgi:hypothetical protein
MYLAGGAGLRSGAEAPTRGATIPDQLLLITTHGESEGTMTTTAKPRIPATRLASDNVTVLQQLGLLADLAGTWEGQGFNLIARPDFHDNANLYLQLNQTHETLTVEPIGSPIPNRGFGQDDIALFGLSYLQKVSDLPTGGALHFEPGLWVTQPPTEFPPETAEPGEQLIFRMGSIPHGNAMLAEGTAAAFSGAPTLPDGKVPYAFSTFPSFNSTPFPAGGPINAAGSSELGTVTGGFTQYTISNAASLANPRTPFDTDPPEPPLPADINGVPMQVVVNDPISLLQQQIKQQVAAGDTFNGVALNIATQQQITFLNTKNDPNVTTSGVSAIDVIDAGGGVENIPFLDGENLASLPAPNAAPNAQTALVYATFWIEQVTPKNRQPFMQLQYAQFTVLDFPIFTVLHPAPGSGGTPKVVNLGWPHVSVATLRKTFN